MNRTAIRWWTAAGVAIVLPLAGCASGPQEEAAPTFDPDAPVTIVVGEKPPAEQAELLAAFEERVATFEDLHPNVTIESEETVWATDTYQAMLAGGTMPTTLRVPLTEIQGLAEREQVADLTPYLDQNPVTSVLNPALLPPVSRDGSIYGVPVGSFNMGIVYNRDLYTEAGLDPDQPPATWDEVRDNARTIQDETGVTGFVISTTSNFGGFALTGMSYGFGGMLQEEEGDETISTVDGEATQAALQFVKDIRWDDDTFGANFLLSADDIQRELGAGNVAQAVIAADRYNSLVVNWKMDPDAIGIGPLPQSDDGLGTLGGGNISVISPTATPEQKAAALRWISFFYLDKFVDEDAAVADAVSRVESGLPVGSPVVPLVDEAANETYLEYIADDIDVPREHFATYLDSIQTLPLLPEPRVKAQQIYALLDSTVQAVLTDENADVEALLEQANTQAQSLIDAG